MFLCSVAPNAAFTCRSHATAMLCAGAPSSEARGRTAAWPCGHVVVRAPGRTCGWAHCRPGTRLHAMKCRKLRATLDSPRKLRHYDVKSGPKCRKLRVTLDSPRKLRHFQKGALACMQPNGRVADSSCCRGGCQGTDRALPVCCGKRFLKRAEKSSCVCQDNPIYSVLVLRHLNGRLAQGESASLTRKRSQVQIL